MKKCECDFDKGKGPIQSHLSWKIGPLYIFFIIFVDPVYEYLTLEKLEKKSKLEIIFYSWKSVKIWLWGTFIIGTLFKTWNWLHPIFFLKSHCNNV